jgi:hypothetical protein
MKKSNPNTRQVGQIQPSQGLKAKPLLAFVKSHRESEIATMNSRYGVRSGLPPQARLSKARLLLHLLTARTRNQQQAGSTMVAGILVILALLVGTLGVVAIVNGSNLASFGSSEARDSQQVAEAGADQIIATFNQPENRQLLVAGSTAPNTWSTTN